MSILLTEDTTFIVQGITGREAMNLTRECLDYGKGASGERTVSSSGVRFEISGGDATMEVDDVSDQIEAAGELCSAKGHEAKAQSTGRTGSGSLGGIHTEITFDDLGEPCET